MCRLRQLEFCDGNKDVDIAGDVGQGSKGDGVQRTETGEVKRTSGSQLALVGIATGSWVW